MHVDHKTFTLLPSVEICAFYLMFHFHIVADLEPQASQSVHPKPRKCFRSNFYHVIESHDDDEEEEEEAEFRINGASIHEGHLYQNGILTLLIRKRLKS